MIILDRGRSIPLRSTSYEGRGLHPYILYNPDMPVLARNKRATFDYEILERIEAGIVLTGQEVKSAKTGHAKLQGAFVNIRNGEAWIKNLFIAPYSHAGQLDHYEPSQNRRLLIHRREIVALEKKLDGERLTIVPISLYTKAGNIKVELGLARGKRQFEKRNAIRGRELDRDARRLMGKS